MAEISAGLVALYKFACQVAGGWVLFRNTSTPHWDSWWFSLQLKILDWFFSLSSVFQWCFCLFHVWFVWDWWVFGIFGKIIGMPGRLPVPSGRWCSGSQQPDALGVNRQRAISEPQFCKRWVDTLADCIQQIESSSHPEAGQWRVDCYPNPGNWCLDRVGVSGRGCSPTCFLHDPLQRPISPAQHWFEFCIVSWQRSQWNWNCVATLVSKWDPSACWRRAIRWLPSPRVYPNWYWCGSRFREYWKIPLCWASIGETGNAAATSATFKTCRETGNSWLHFWAPSRFYGILHCGSFG